MENNLNFLVDSHCHLIFDDYKDDIEQVIERAFDAGVKGLVVISTQEKEFNSIVDIYISETYETYKTYEKPQIRAEGAQNFGVGNFANKPPPLVNLDFKTRGGAYLEEFI